MTSRLPRFHWLCIATLSAASLVACGGKAKPAPAVEMGTPTSTASATAEAKPAAVSPSVGVSDDLAKSCGLRFSNPEKAPTFGYNDDELLPADRAVLQQIADCLTKGPLKDKKVQLVGRADPRGTDEYNLGLGSRRAQHVRTYLERLGVPASRLSPTTRGEIDAAGTDESGWQRDRRVDLELMN